DRVELAAVERATPNVRTRATSRGASRGLTTCQDCSVLSVASIDRSTIESTYALIRPHIRRTPIVEIDGRELGLAAFPLTLKLEQLQHAGAFKTRGAFTNLLTRRVPSAGVVAASGGNHGVAVAYAAQVLGVPARIYVPTVSSPAKIERIRGYGANLVI